MKSIFTPLTGMALLSVLAISISNNPQQTSTVSDQPTVVNYVKPVVNTKIQAAILLDVSGSMSGLIDQAKAQLWNMVSIMGKVQSNGQTPQIEIALYEYGRPGDGVTTGYIKQISPFTSDLDKLSQELFSLTTDGGDEYCGKVIFTSLKELNWDTASSNYKVIFIAGNEDFLQGDVLYTKSCDEAKKKGVIVNTIYCGDRMQGIREHWSLSSECGNGSYTNINHNATIDDIATPYDSLLVTYNEKLNGTYITYGSGGAIGFTEQSKADDANYQFNKSVAMKRIAVKGKKELYKNTTWDAVDASTANPKFVETIDKTKLADSLKNKTTEELKTIITEKMNERAKVQAEIERLSIEREKFIAVYKSKSATNGNTATLETEVEKIIKQQVKLFNMSIQ